VGSMQISSTRILELIEILSIFSKDCADSIESAAALISKTFLAGGKVLICGNGGSAADSQHFAAEFVSTFSKDIIRQGLPAIALTVDTSFITAYSNDFKFAGIFSRQVEALGRPGDILIALTTSGSSDNCLQAVYKAKEKGLSTIAFTRTSGAITSEADISIEVPSTNTQHIQECHMVAYHVITELVEESLFGGALE
jgi:phosphoheptose isomerase